MTVDREQELQASILRLTNEVETLKRHARGLQRDLDHATGDVVSKMSADVSYCRRLLEALNNKMRLVDDEELEEERHGQESGRPTRGRR